MNQIRRYHYTCKLITYERLYATSKDQANFIESHDTLATKLPVFDFIHQLSDCANDDTASDNSDNDSWPRHKLYSDEDSELSSLSLTKRYSEGPSWSYLDSNESDTASLTSLSD